MTFDPPERDVSTSEDAPYSEAAAPYEVVEVAPRRTRESTWPKAVIVVGVGLTIAWIGLLGFGLIKLIAYAM